jgi:hypothetical protein
VRQQKEKTLGPAWMPKHEAQQKLQNQAVVQFLITDDRRVERHLTQLGYYRDARAGLSIEAVDAGGLRLRGILHDLQHGTAGTELLEAELTSADEQFASHGRCRLIDEGSDAIIRTEESALRDLKFSFAYNVSPPVRKAWNLLEPIVGRDRLRSRTKTDLWASRICRVEETTPADDDIAIVNSLTNELLCRRESGKHWHVITGAAGTGKTRLVATMAHTYLARSRPQTDQRKSRHSHRIRGMATIPELLDGHITLAVECLDRT